MALTVVFGLQMIRVLISLMGYYLRDSIGLDPLTLAPIALGIFALSFLAAPLRRLLGLRTALIITAGGTALFRAVQQLTFESSVELGLVAAGVALFGMFIPIALEMVRPQGEAGTGLFALALLLGLTADTALHATTWTVDLAWQRGPLAAIVVFLLFIAAIVLLRQSLKWDELKPEPNDNWGWARVLALAAIGPWLFLQMVVFQNVARMAAVTGWSLPIAALVIGLGNVIGLIAATHAPRSKGAPGQTLAVGVIFVIILFFLENEGVLGAIVSVAGQVLAASLITTILVALGWLSQGNGRMGAPAANGIGQLLYVILIFVFYVSFDMNLGFRANAALPFAGILLSLAAIWVIRGMVGDREMGVDYTPVIIAGLLLLLPLGLLLSWQTPESTVAPIDNASLRILNYNLHNGFNAAGQLDMEALAQVIEEADPDVLALQEVSRGWVLNGSADMMQWLSQRLELPYVFGPTEGMLWGNAVLSRYPIVDSQLGALPPDSLRLRRGYVLAEVDAGSEQIQLIDTHLHQIEADSDIRQEQVPALIEAWNMAPRTVLTGDFNAIPDSPEIQALANAGLVDVGEAIGPSPGYTFYSADPSVRIDYIWASPDLVPVSFEIPDTTASDHFPLLATITWE